MVIGGVLLLVLGYGMLRSGLWLEERFRIHFAGSGALFPYALIAGGLYALVRGLLGI
jgi:hypothetical protein